MSSTADFELEPPKPAGWDWHTLLTSVLFHCCLILVLLLWDRRHPAPVVAPTPGEQRLTLEPPVAFEERPRVESRPVPPPPPARPIPLGPDSDHPDAPVAQEQGNPQPIPEDAPLTPDPGGTPEAVPNRTETPPPPANATHIPTAPEVVGHGVPIAPNSPFGKRPPIFASLPPARTSTAAGTSGRAGFGDQDTRGFRQSFADAAGQCVKIPDPGVNSDGSPVLFSVVGVVRDQSGRPLPNAHLQLVGQIYATFSDGQGNYRLEFNPKLLEECRVQVVRVSAEGFRTSDLQLAIGQRVQSDDVILRRR